MEIRFTVAQALFGCVFGALIAAYFHAEWWGYVLAISAVGAIAYLTSLWRLRRLDLKPDTRFLDYIEALKRRWSG